MHSRLKFLWLLVGIALLLGITRFVSTQPTPAQAANIEVRPSPGQLTILDKDGKADGLCPLKHTDVQADIAGYVSRVTVTQEFTNPSNEPVEAVYTFPLPSDAAVNDMTMTLGSRVIQGQIKRREEAHQIYEMAKSQGKSASLLDQERPNIFTQSVANILPGENVKITIRYVNLRKYEDGKYEWTFPMVVGPRFIGSTVKDAAKITPPITPPNTRAGHDISVHVSLDAGVPLGDVQAVLHQITVARQGGSRATIDLENQNEIPNKDFILRYTAAGSEIQSGVLTYAASTSERAGGYFTLILQPPLAPKRTEISPKEMIFVIDQTGSQMGWPIEKAKDTMRHCIQHLNPGDTFQLLGFNTDVYPCFPQPVPATAENINKALAYLQPLQGAGGTDILKAANYALTIPEDPNRLRMICFMTDGYVGNDMQIIDFVKTHRGNVRMFPLGVGNSVNRFLIDGIAREGRGASDYVTLDEEGAVAANRFYHRVADPVLLNISVDWNGMPIEDVFPQQIPDLFSQTPIILKGRYTHAGEGDVTVHGVLHGKPWQQVIHVMFPAAKADGSAISTLWAREKIEDLQNQDWIGAQTNQPKPEIQQQIINTALEYKLMSQWTSFVAVEERVVNVGGKQRTVNVPVEMPSGVSYDGIFGDKETSVGAIPALSSVNGSFYAMTAAPGGNAGVQSGFGVGGGGGFGGRGSVRAVQPQHAVPMAKSPTVSASPPPINMPVPLIAGKVKASDAISESNEKDVDKKLADGTPEAQKQLAAMKPSERHALLMQLKIAPELSASATATPQGRLDVQIWLNALPPDGLAKLKALGFNLTATLTTNKLLLGTIDAAKLEKLADLGFVRYVEAPKFK